MKKRNLAIIISALIVTVVLVSSLYLLFKGNEIENEQECFRSVEWFSTASQALNWSLNEAPRRIESFSRFIYYDYGIIVTRHEIIVRPTEKWSFGYDAIIIFYGKQK